MTTTTTATHTPCCSSHGVDMTCERYRRTHFVEVRPCCSLDRLALEAEQAAHDDATDPRVNPCPECPWGEVVDDGPMERDTGHQPRRCSENCGWTA